jgi:hypothetical protein
MHSSPAVLVPPDSPYVAAAGRAIEQGFGRPPVLIREGGSIPIVTDLREKLGVDSLLLGWGLDDDNAHAPNEKFSLADFPPVSGPAPTCGTNWGASVARRDRRTARDAPQAAGNRRATSETTSEEETSCSTANSLSKTQQIGTAELHPPQRHSRYRPVGRFGAASAAANW